MFLEKGALPIYRRAVVLQIAVATLLATAQLPAQELPELLTNRPSPVTSEQAAPSVDIFTIPSASSASISITVPVVPPDIKASLRPLPVYLSELSNLNSYSLFANSGWDANWYVGFNLCWIEQLPVPPPGEYRRAFIGAKLGRMKLRSVPGKPVWEKEPVPGSIYMAVSSTAAWKDSQKRFLVDGNDIPLDGDPDNAREGTGEARWFWTEIPLADVDLGAPNYAVIWSPSEYFVAAASSPVLAGGWGGQKQNSWMNNEVRGYPPLNPARSLKTAITAFEPAIAMKLIPAGTEQNIEIYIDAIAPGRERTTITTVTPHIVGESIERAWLEYSTDGGATWHRHGRFVYDAPFSLTLKPELLPAGTTFLRIAAADIWENTGYSTMFNMDR